MHFTLSISQYVFHTMRFTLSISHFNNYIHFINYINYLHLRLTIVENHSKFAYFYSKKVVLNLQVIFGTKTNQVYISLLLSEIH